MRHLARARCGGVLVLVTHTSTKPLDVGEEIILQAFAPFPALFMGE